VGFLERLGDLSSHAQAVGQRQSAILQPAMQCFAGDVLHHQEQRARVFANFKDLADVRVIERGDGHRLASQPLSRARVSGGFDREQLDGDLTIETRVAGAIHLAHPARTERGKDLVRAKARTWEKREKRQAALMLTQTAP